MMCYKDKTFCGFYQECKCGDTCPSALTEKVIESAKACNLDISRYMYPPSRCFEEKVMAEVNIEE